MQYFPICLNLAGKKCLVVGAGSVGRRKVRNLLEYGAEDILLVDRQATLKSEQEFAAYEQVDIQKRHFDKSDVQDKFLVFVCTWDRELNEHIGEICRRKGILCNIATSPEQGDFIQPALLKQGELSITVSSHGKSPALVKKIKDRLKQDIGPEYATLTEILGRLRAPVLDLQKDSSYNKEIFDSLTDKDILDAVKDKDRERVLQLMQEKTPSSVHSNLKEIIDELL